MVWHAAVAKVRQRMAEGRELPVQYRDNFRPGWVQHQVAEAEIAMSDSGFIPLGRMRRQPLHQPLHRRQVAGLGGLILLRPAIDLPLHILIRAAIAFQADGLPVDPMQLGERIRHGFVDGPTLLFGSIGQCRVFEYPAFDEVHHVKRRADNAVVLAQQACGRHRHIGLLQCLDHTILALNLMGRG